MIFCLQAHGGVTFRVKQIEAVLFEAVLRRIVSSTTTQYRYFFLSMLGPSCA